MMDRRFDAMTFLFSLIYSTCWILLAPSLFTGVSGNIVRIAYITPTTWPCLLAIWFGEAVLFRYGLFAASVGLPFVALLFPSMEKHSMAAVWTTIWIATCASLISLLGVAAVAVGG